MVVKDIIGLHALARLSFGRLIMRREERVLRVLDGTPGVPRYLGRIDRDAFARSTSRDATLAAIGLPSAVALPAST